MSKKHKKREWHIPQLSLPVKAALIAVVIISVAVILILVLHNLGKPDTKSQGAGTGKTQDEGAVRDSAQKAISQGDTVKANAEYSQAIKGESDPAKKVQLALDQSGVLYAANNYASAINVAKQAQSYSTDQYLVADWLSRLYEDQKQYTLAAQYYTLAGLWAGSPTNKTGLTQSYYNQQAARVSALAGQK